MNLFDLLKPEAVKVIANVSSKKRLMQDLAEHTESIYGIESDSALQALLPNHQRPRESPTRRFPACIAL